jgi:glycosyltransferase involved in cell wall biosynthesis
MMTKPFFSIVIPFYNRFQLVKETIRSVIEQRNQDMEIILVDDGSNDGSSAMLDEAYGQHPGIKIIHQSNLERAAARNRGFNESSGAYVVFLDSDDLMLPDHLETLYIKIKSLNGPDFIATKYQFLSHGKRKASSVAGLAEGYYDYRLFLDGNPFGCNICVKKNNPDLKLFPQDRSLSIKEDWLFFLNNLRHIKLYLIDKVTLLMVDHEI